MKKPLIITAIGTVTATVTALCITSYQKSMLGTLPLTLPKDFTVTAHTGCEKTKDNTLESIRAGAEAGADIVEIDLHFLPDGTPVLNHDAPSGDNYPTLEAAFELLKELDVKMNVDVKSTANMPAVHELSQKHGVKGKIFFTGVEEKDVEAVKNGAPGIPYYLNVSVDEKKNTDLDYLSALAEKVKSCGAMGINMNLMGGSEELVRFFRSEGLLVSLWTANKKSEMRRCLKLCPDNITTRNVTLLKSLIK